MSGGSVNKVILIGNLTRNPELRCTSGGTPLCEFGLATNRTWKNNDGAKQEEVTFIDITFWGKQAEVINQYMSKGKKLYVEGRLKFDSWESKDGSGKRSKLTVVGENFTFLDSGRNGGSSDREAPARVAEPAGAPAGAASEGYGAPDDDIPF